MKENNIWLIDIGAKRKLKVIGKTLEQAVKDYGKNNPNKEIECGLLVAVYHNNTKSYWSGEKFLECLE